MDTHRLHVMQCLIDLSMKTRCVLDGRRPLHTSTLSTWANEGAAFMVHTDATAITDALHTEVQTSIC
jgi:hypothetical protein